MLQHAVNIEELNLIEVKEIWGNSFDIVLTPLNGKDARYGKVTLTGLPERKTPTRLYIEISMTGENKVRLYVEDLGFGELSPSGYQKWTENFEI